MYKLCMVCCCTRRCQVQLEREGAPFRELPLESLTQVPTYREGVEM